MAELMQGGVGLAAMAVLRNQMWRLSRVTVVMRK
jgi:hypothetical protein